MQTQNFLPVLLLQQFWFTQLSFLSFLTSVMPQCCLMWVKYDLGTAFKLESSIKFFHQFSDKPHLHNVHLWSCYGSIPLNNNLNRLYSNIMLQSPAWFPKVCVFYMKTFNSVAHWTRFSNWRCKIHEKIFIWLHHLLRKKRYNFLNINVNLLNSKIFNPIKLNF